MKFLTYLKLEDNGTIDVTFDKINCSNFTKYSYEKLKKGFLLLTPLNGQNTVPEISHYSDIIVNKEYEGTLKITIGQDQLLPRTTYVRGEFEDGTRAEEYLSICSEDDSYNFFEGAKIALAYFLEQNSDKNNRRFAFYKNLIKKDDKYLNSVGKVSYRGNTLAKVNKKSHEHILEKETFDNITTQRISLSNLELTDYSATNKKITIYLGNYFQVAINNREGTPPRYFDYSEDAPSIEEQIFLFFLTDFLNNRKICKTIGKYFRKTNLDEFKEYFDLISRNSLNLDKLNRDIERYFHSVRQAKIYETLIKNLKNKITKAILEL